MLLVYFTPPGDFCPIRKLIAPRCYSHLRWHFFVLSEFLIVLFLISCHLGAYRVRYRSQSDAPTNVLLVGSTRSFLLSPQKLIMKHIENEFFVFWAQVWRKYLVIFHLCYFWLFCIVYELLKTDATLDTAVKHSLGKLFVFVSRVKLVHNCQFAVDAEIQEYKNTQVHTSTRIEKYKTQAQ